jgi:hypothetical protein
VDGKPYSDCLLLNFEGACTSLVLSLSSFEHGSGVVCSNIDGVVT